ncbi:MAG TPA: hypothetical protein VFA29_08590 [Candidatus Baltobacteraceae bacterium]|nr:hypothetical protein [Candidatus Baltobacteraceae bacterium]
MRNALLILLAAALAACASPGMPSAGAVDSGALAQVKGFPPPSPPVIGGCQVFPSDNWWNTDISKYPVDPNSGAYLKSMNAYTTNLHPDFGHSKYYGIPYVVVPGSQPFVPVTFDIKDQSDPGPYPIPSNAPIEAGSDRHVLVLDSGNCELYEMWRAKYVGPGWHAGSGAIFHLNSDKLRPDYWTSADAAGLPILPGLARWDETQTGVISHALRFTVHATQAGFIHPATHFASNSLNPALPPMGLRVRLKASYDISHFTGNSHTILQALKTYGMFVADNGSDWYITGDTDTRWNDNDLNQLKSVPGSAFEVVQTGPIVH